jgi:hypothetical protein
MQCRPATLDRNPCSASGVLAHHGDQEHQAAARSAAQQAPDYRPETLDMLFGTGRPAKQGATPPAQPRRRSAALTFACAVTARTADPAFSQGSVSTRFPGESS